MNPRIISLSIVSLMVVSLSAIEIPQSSIKTGPGIGEAQLFCNTDGFTVVKDGIKKEVASFDTADILRNATPEQIATLVACKNNKILIRKITDSNNNIDYKLDIDGNLQGGGPTLAGGTAIGVRVLGYGTWLGLCLSVPLTFGGTLLLATEATVFVAEGGVEVAANVATGLAMLAPTP